MTQHVLALQTLCRQTHTHTNTQKIKIKKTLKKAYFNDTIIDDIHLFPRYFLTKYSLCKSTGGKGILREILLNP